MDLRVRRREMYSSDITAWLRCSCFYQRRGRGTVYPYPWLAKAQPNTPGIPKSLSQTMVARVPERRALYQRRAVSLKYARAILSYYCLPTLFKSDVKDLYSIHLALPMHLCATRIVAGWDSERPGAMVCSENAERVRQRQGRQLSCRSFCSTNIERPRSPIGPRTFVPNLTADQHNISVCRTRVRTRWMAPRDISY